MGFLQSKSVFFFDGAFGTYYNKISGKNSFCEFANLSDRNAVLNIHSEYIRAGVNAIKTNTYGANSTLTKDAAELAAVIQSGYEIAMEAASGAGAVVFADIGNIQSDDESVSDEYCAIARQFIRLGATHFIFETLSDFDSILPALRLIKNSVPHAVILVSFAVSQEGYTNSGFYYKTILNQAKREPLVDIVGLNCLCGPSHMYNLLKEVELSGKPFAAMPNSGYPASVNGRTVFRDNTVYFSEKLLQIHSLGVNILGGCCGTTPAHIERAVQSIGTPGKIVPKTAGIKMQAQPAKPLNNRLQSLFAQNKKVIAVELPSPLDTNFSFLGESAIAMQQQGADLITIADSPLARTRADSIMISAKIKRETGMEVVPHLTCRDKNHIGIKASLIAGKIESVDTVFVITGDPIAQSERGTCKGVFNFNSVNLLSFITQLNTELFSESPYLAGGALNVNAVQFHRELERAQQKIAAGAVFLMSQPLFSEEAVQNLLQAKKELHCRLFAGLLPIASYKNALFLNNEVSGITIPENIIEQLKDKSSEEVMQISVDYCMDIIKKVHSTVDGYYIMTPLKKVDYVCALIQKIRSFVP